MIPEGIVIRTIEPSDSLHELTDLLHSAYASLGELGLNYTAVDQSPETTAQRISRGQCFVATRGSRLVGTILVEPPSPDSPSEHYSAKIAASAHQLAVAPEEQGSGLGASLLERAETWARDRGYRELALDTAEPANHLRAFYQRRGYRDVGFVQWKGKVYRSVVMTKQLTRAADRMKPPLVIETPRLRLRPPVEADVEAIFEYASDAAVTAMMDWRRLTDRQQVVDFLARTSEGWRSGTEFTWVTTELHSDFVIGATGIRVRETDADFGYVLNRRYWGRGFAAEAASPVVSWAATVLGLPRIWATCDTENSGSMRVLEKLGLVRQGLAPGKIVRPNISEDPRDSFVYVRVSGNSSGNVDT